MAKIIANIIKNGGMIIMIEKESQIKELYELKHRKDKELYTHFDYENNLILKTMSKYIYRNDNMFNFLNFLKKQWVWMIESILPLRNFYNYTVNKYYNKHNC